MHAVVVVDEVSTTLFIIRYINTRTKETNTFPDCKNNIVECDPRISGIFRMNYPFSSSQVRNNEIPNVDLIKNQTHVLVPLKIFLYTRCGWNSRKKQYLPIYMYLIRNYVKCGKNLWFSHLGNCAVNVVKMKDECHFHHVYINKRKLELQGKSEWQHLWSPSIFHSWHSLAINMFVFTVCFPFCSSCFHPPYFLSSIRTYIQYAHTEVVLCSVLQISKIKYYFSTVIILQHTNLHY